MKKGFIISISVIAIVAIIIGAILFYWDRDQEIDFSGLLPNELEHCGHTLNQNSPEYIELVAWFQSNQHGWRNTLVTFVPASMYTGTNFSVNAMKDGVVVNYRTKSDSWAQVMNQKKDTELVDQCAKANKALNSQPSAAGTLQSGAH